MKNGAEPHGHWFKKPSLKTQPEQIEQRVQSVILALLFRSPQGLCRQTSIVRLNLGKGR